MRKKMLNITKRTIAMLLVLATLCGCGFGGKRIYEEGVYSRLQSYDCAFSIESTKVGNNEFSFEKGQFTDDEKNDVIAYVSENQKQITKALKHDIEIPNKELHYYIVNQLNAEEPVVDGTAVFLDRDTCQSEQVTFYTLRAMLDCYASTKLYGLAGYVSETPVELAEVKTYVSNHPEVLDFFCGRCNQSYVSAEDAKQFLDVVNAFSGYLIEKKGLEDYWASEITISDVQDWVSDAGMQADVEAWTDRNLLANLEADVLPGYELCLLDGEIKYLFRNCATYFQDVNELADLMKTDRYVRNTIGQYFADNGLKDWEPKANINHLRYQISYDSTALASTAHPDDLDAPYVDISLPKSLEVTHEFMHIWLAAESKPSDRYWLEEGMCEYFAHLVYTPDNIREGLFHVLDDPAYENGEYAEYYHSKRPGEVTEDNFDLRVAHDYYAYKQVVCNEATDASEVTPSSLSGWRANGDDLSYIAAQSFAAYLVDRYGFATVIEFLEGKDSYTQAFGKSFKTLKTDWMDYLKPESE